MDRISICELRRGDIVFGLVKNNVGIVLSVVSQSPYSHVFVMINNTEYIEASPEGVRRCVITDATTDGYFYMDVYRYLGSDDFYDAVIGKIGCRFFSLISVVRLIIFTMIRWAFCGLGVRMWRFNATKGESTFSCCSLISRAICAANGIGDLSAARLGWRIPLCRFNFISFSKEMINYASEFLMFRPILNPKSLSSSGPPELISSRERLVKGFPSSGVCVDAWRISVDSCMPMDLIGSGFMSYAGRL